MSQSSEAGAPPIEVRLDQRPPSKFARERAAFYRLLPHLLTPYRGQYVAIHDEQVAEAGAERLEVAMRVLSRVGNVDIYVGLVTDGLDQVVRSGIVRDAYSRAVHGSFA